MHEVVIVLHIGGRRPGCAQHFGASGVGVARIDRLVGPVSIWINANAQQRETQRVVKRVVFSGR